MGPARLDVEQLTVDERIALIGELWHSLDAAAVAPITPALAAELTCRETETVAAPERGVDWETIERELRARLR